MRRPQHGPLLAAPRRRPFALAGRLGEHGLGVLSKRGRPAAGLPACRGREPLADAIAQRSAELRMLDVAKAVAPKPVLVERALVRLAQRGPEEACLLSFAPRRRVVPECANEPLDDFENVRLALVAPRRPRHVAGAQISVASRRLQIGAHVVAVEERHELGLVSRAHAPRDVPAPILGVRHIRRMVRLLHRVPACQAIERRAAHDPAHEIKLGVLRHRLVHRAGDILAFAGAQPVQERGDGADGQLFAGDVIGVPKLRRDRGQIVAQARIRVVAAVHHDAAEREMDKVGALELRPRAVVAERRHARDDEAGKAADERVAIEAEPGVERAAARIDQKVGAANQAHELIAAFVRPGVEDDRAFVAIVMPEEDGALRDRENRRGTARSRAWASPRAARP